MCLYEQVHQTCDWHEVSRIVGKSPTLFLPADITFKLPIIAAVYVEHFSNTNMEIA